MDVDSARGLMEPPFLRVYDYLNVGNPPESADCIFVLAGRQERKVFGIELWQKGYAPQLILSVGRFEWRKYYELGLASDGGLRAMVDRTLPAQRHFFVSIDGKGARCQWVPPGRFGTWREAQGLAALLKQGEVRSLMVISDAVHLRRAALALRRALRRERVKLIPVAADSDRSLVERRSWWKQPESRSRVLKELFKLVAYRLIF
jgi:uncharacterized SAM-binding protein YcdF (DUF218 family)